VRNEGAQKEKWFGEWGRREGVCLSVSVKIYSCSSGARGKTLYLFFFINNRVLGVNSLYNTRVWELI
jgi:hypothetical protein